MIFLNINEHFTHEGGGVKGHLEFFLPKIHPNLEAESSLIEMPHIKYDTEVRTALSVFD